MKTPDELRLELQDVKTDEEIVFPDDVDPLSQLAVMIDDESGQVKLAKKPKHWRMIL